MTHKITLQILSQPDDYTCGPTCLHAVYNYYGDEISLYEVIEQVPTLYSGGTLAVMLGCHALKRGYKATIYSYNLELFDPSWFELSSVEIIHKLKKQKKFKRWRKFHIASNAYIRFLRLGGELKFEDLTASLLLRYLTQQIPILTGLSATYLYKSKREFNNQYDDIRGRPSGHFVVITGYDPKTCDVYIADPYTQNPRSKNKEYKVSLEHLICAIMLGIVTYDANFLIIEKS